MTTTTAILPCDRCGLEIDGYTFGRRVTENWCWRCWFAWQDETPAEVEAALKGTEVHLGATGRTDQIAELKKQIEDLSEDLFSAELKARDAEDEANAIRDDLRAAEKALCLLTKSQQPGKRNAPALAAPPAANTSPATSTGSQRSAKRAKTTARK